MAVIVDPGTTDATIRLAESDTPLQKRYKYMVQGMQVSAGDMVFAIKVSGVYVLLGGQITGQGPAGQGVPAGGARHDALVKQSAADYDTKWSPLLYRGEDGGLCEVDEI